MKNKRTFLANRVTENDGDDYTQLRDYRCQGCNRRPRNHRDGGSLVCLWEFYVQGRETMERMNRAGLWFGDSRGNGPWEREDLDGGWTVHGRYCSRKCMEKHNASYFTS